MCIRDSTGPIGDTGPIGPTGPAVDTTTFMVNNADTGTTGKLGAGTKTPSEQLDVLGAVRSFKNAGDDSANLLLRANFPDTFGWKLSTIDRGGGVDLDLWASD